MFKAFKKIAGLASLGIVGFFLILVIGVAWLALGAAFWGWAIMLIAGATGHAWMGYQTAWLWGFIPAFLTGS